MAVEARARMLESTAALLQRRGFYGTSLSDILTESGAPRGSLYHHFPGGKEQLVLEAMRESVTHVTQLLQRCMRDAATPGDGVRAYVAAAAAEITASNYRLGCPVAGVVLDVVDGDSALLEACRRALDEWARVLEHAFTGAGLEATRAASLAMVTVSAVEGAILVARARRDPAPLTALADELGTAVDAALSSRARSP